MARFDVEFPPGSAARKEKFQQRLSQFRSTAALIDLVNRPPTVDPEEACTKQVAKVEDVSDVSSCRCRPTTYCEEARGMICRLLDKIE